MLSSELVAEYAASSIKALAEVAANAEAPLDMRVRACEAVLKWGCCYLDDWMVIRVTDAVAGFLGGADGQG